MAFLGTLLQYRYFTLLSILQEIRGDYQRGRIGFFWVFLNPLLQVLIYSLILTNVLKAKLPGADYAYAYSMYLMGGILAWSLFDGVVRETMDVFIRGKTIIHNSTIPLSVFLVITIAKNIALNIILLLIMLAFGAVLGVWQGFSFLVIPLLMGVLVLFSTAVGLLLGLFNVFYRDVSSAVRAVLPLMFWITPIVYPLSIVDERVQGLFAVNPMTHFTSAYQAALAFGALPDVQPLLVILIVSLLLLALNLLLYRRLRSDLVDML